MKQPQVCQTGTRAPQGPGEGYGGAVHHLEEFGVVHIGKIGQTIYRQARVQLVGISGQQVGPGADGVEGHQGIGVISGIVTGHRQGPGAQVLGALRNRL
jgi:hypothetical protein